MAEIRPLVQSDIDAVFKLAAELRSARRYDEMEALLRVAVALAPASPASHHNLGGVYKILGRLEDAELCARQALAIDPTLPVVRHALGIILLSQGRISEGFSYYESRHDIPSLGNPKPKLPFPEWQGEPVLGRHIIILPEQGFGDAIQFARFANVLQAKGATVTIVARPELHTLFTRTLSCKVIGPNDNLMAVEPDVWVLSGSLAWRLGLEMSDISGAPYLRIPAAMAGPGSKLRIGLATQGATTHVNDANRSLPADMRALIMRLPGEIVSLHPEDTRATDFDQTADLIAGLDLVISVDTAVAHLAAAMGKPTWTLIPAANTDWRWGMSGELTPWYDTMRLFRQPALGDWRTPILAMQARLEAGVV